MFFLEIENVVGNFFYSENIFIVTSWWASKQPNKITFRSILFLFYILLRENQYV